MQLQLDPRDPLPTPAPKPEWVARALHARQLYTTGPDGEDTIFGDVSSLCGFQDGDAAIPLTCGGFDALCITDGPNELRGCCESPYDSCTLYTSCVEYGASCDTSCRSDSLVTKCTNAAFDSCYTVAYIDGDTTQREIGCGVSIAPRMAYISPTTTKDTLPAAYLALPTSPPAGNAEAISSYVSAFAANAPELVSQGMPSDSSSPSSDSLGPARTSSGSLIANPNPTNAEESAAAAASSSSQTGNDSSGGLSEGATIGIAVSAAAVGLGIIAAATFLLWKRRKNAGTSAKANHNLGSSDFQPGMVQNNPRYAAAGIPPEPDYWAQNLSKVDDDALARNRRFSDEGTVSMTVAGRTNDEYLPQAA